MKKTTKPTNRKATEKRPTPTVSRKAEHVALALSANVGPRVVTTGFEQFRFTHNALPELDLEKIDLSAEWLGKRLSAPLIISSMTGGYADAEVINRSLAKAAAEFGIAMGIGSARQALEDERFLRSFSVAREAAPDAILFSNIGAAEVAKLSAQGKIASLGKLVKLLKADALAIHLNPLQELMQPEGTRNFEGVLVGIERATREIDVPVIVKEVGAGISADVASRLLSAGVRTIDVAGAGGTSWAGIEILRNKKQERDWLEPFWDWGIPTAQSLIEVSRLRGEHSFTLIASGGIKDGVEIAKAIALGADLAGIARPLLQALQNEGEAGLRTFIEHIIFQLRSAMFLTGSQNLRALRDQKLHRETRV